MVSTARGYLRYLACAINRELHAQGHSGADCTVSDEIDRVLGETHTGHPEFFRIWREYAQLRQVPVREVPVCRNCGNVAPVYLGIPNRVMGATLIRGGIITECGMCGYRIDYKPRNLT